MFALLWPLLCVRAWWQRGSARLRQIREACVCAAEGVCYLGCSMGQHKLMDYPNPQKPFAFASHVVIHVPTWSQDRN